MMLSFVDQLNNSIEVSFPPKRIVSLVPSQTELLYSLGLEKEIIGITKFCMHPNRWFRTKQRVGGTKTIKTDRVKALQPDLIIANKEENVKEQIEELRTIAPVWVSDVETLQDALAMISLIGKLVNKASEASKMVADIESRFQYMQPLKPQVATAYLIWKDPYMTVGGDTFISDIMHYCGFDNIFKHHKRYPQTSMEEISKMSCRLLLLSSEPYPFKEKHIMELQQQLPGTKIARVDGEMFSWYGSRLVLAPAYLTELLRLLSEK